MSGRAALSALLLLILACVTSGCSQETVEGDTTIYTFATWVPMTVLGSGLAAFVLGLALRHWSKGLAWTLLIGSMLVLLVFTPGLFADKVTVSPERFTLRTGFWFMPTEHDVAFADLSSIHFIKEEKRGSKGRTSTSYFLVCQRKEGGQVKVPVGDLMKQGPAVHIMELAESHGIPVIDETE